MKRINRATCISIAAAILLCGTVVTVRAGIFDAGNGNPIVPGYFADPFVFHDDSMFYIYSSTDGYDRGSWTNWGPFGVWYSKDFSNWSFKTFDYPANFPYMNLRLWAPSVTKAANGKYYMYYSRNGDSCYVVSASSPLGPWSNEKNGNRLYTSHVFDTDVLKDTDSTYYIVYQAHTGSTYSLYLAKLGSTMDTIIGTPTVLFAGGTALSEGATIFKRDTTYYLTFSQGSVGATYHVVYGYSRTGIAGPYTFPSGNTILQSSSANNITATGHSSVLKLDTSYYIIGYGIPHQIRTCFARPAPTKSALMPMAPLKQLHQPTPVSALLLH
jgi:beta-xylosidase